MNIKSMKNTFNNIYLNILYESKNNIDFDKNKYLEFLTSLTKFTKTNIITEDKNNLIDIPTEFIQYLIQNCNTIIDSTHIKYFLKDSKHWQNLKNIKFKNIFFGLFDFSNEKEIDKFHVNCFNIPIEYLNEARNEFKYYAGDLFGFYNSYENFEVVCVNTKCSNIFQTVYHELSHFIQANGNIRIVKEISLDEIKQKNVLKNIFQTDYDQVISYFSNKEFIPHVDDLIHMLHETKQQYYFNISNFEFLEKLNEFLHVKNRDEMIQHEFFQNFNKANNNNYDTLAMLLFSYISKYKFQKIFNIIKQKFIL